MQSDSAPPVGGDTTPVASDRTETVGDPVRRFLENSPSPVRRVQARHWVGIGSLALGVAGAAIFVPPLITETTSTSTPVVAVSSGSPVDQAVPASVTSSVAPSAGPASAVPSAAVSRAPAATPGQTKTVTVAPTPSTSKKATATTATTATTAADAARFTAVSVEAEDATLSDGAATVACTTCTAGVRVRFVGRVDAYLSVAAAGSRTITVTYEVEGDRSLTVAVNGTEVLTDRTVTGTSWETPKTISFTAAVPAGTVNVALYGGGLGAPDIDKISIS
ncbi:hypothetical protein [Actinoplanes sp. NPDC051851]|uniref:hypothetical protein n=1 Tax=Actinoplanes sp. NPDC051851 TaxID=3154753 RepID=UPI00343DD84B